MLLVKSWSMRFTRMYVGSLKKCYKTVENVTDSNIKFPSLFYVEFPTARYTSWATKYLNLAMITDK